MKKIIFIFLIVASLNFNVEAEEGYEDIMDEYISSYSEELQAAAQNENGDNIRAVLPDFNTETLLRKSASGQEVFELGDVLGKLWELLWGEVKNTLKIMLYVMILSVLCSYLSALSNERNKDVSNIAFYACYIIIAGICSATFLDIMECGLGAVNNMVLIARVVVPVVITSLAVTGAVTSATVFQPMFLGIIEISLTVIKKFFVPIIMLLTSLNIVNCMSEKINAEKMVQFLSKVVKWGLSVMLTIFVGAAGLQSFASGSFDGLSVKLTKFAASNLIPVVGGILSESVETVMNCSVIIKNAVGIVGIVILVLSMALPLVKIAACLIVMRLTAAIIQPVSDEKTVKCLSGTADAVGLIFGIVFAVTIMLVLVLTIMLNAGNSAIMLGR